MEICHDKEGQKTKEEEMKSAVLRARQRTIELLVKQVLDNRLQ
jgi:hypothetical protein